MLKKKKVEKKEMKKGRVLVESELKKQIEEVKIGKKPKQASRDKMRILYILVAIVGILLSGSLLYYGWINIFLVFIGSVVLIFVYFILKKKMKKYGDLKRMEDSFPDFISLMASNLRAGVTVDKALFMSSRKEFAPLDEHINSLGKDIMTGKDINDALMVMSSRINSEEIRKTILLIISGIKSGGNLSVLLEQVASNMRERNFVKKRAASNVLMYVIFIFTAVAFGAPILFGLSSVLVGVLTQIVSDLPSEQISNINIPFVLTEISISVSFILYFSVVFIIATDVFASMILGLVSKGQEREGAKYIIPLILISLTVFFVSRLILQQYFPSFLG
jgi:hypothetical protein